MASNADFNTLSNDGFYYWDNLRSSATNYPPTFDINRAGIMFVISHQQFAIQTEGTVAIATRYLTSDTWAALT